MTLTLSDDAKAIALLCLRLEKKEPSLRPLEPKEYSTFARWLAAHGMRPASLFEPHVDLARLALPDSLGAKRISALLGRGMLLGLVLEELTRSGIHICCRSDNSYPDRYKKKFAYAAPPFFYYAGNLDLAHGGGLAVVGSRNLDSSGEDFARQAGELCARNDMTVISGGARGVDTIAMLAALENGGCAIGVLCGKLRARSVSKDFRKYLSEERLLLLSFNHPDFTFAAWAAMARNKYIYALSDYALVVSSGISAKGKQSGTWEGAVEELKRKDAIPVFARHAEDAPCGNRALLEKGAKKWPENIDRDDNLRSVLKRQAGIERPLAPVKKEPQQGSLLNEKPLAPLFNV